MTNAKKKSKVAHKIAILAFIPFILLVAIGSNVNNSGYLTLIDLRVAEYFIDLRELELVILFSWITLFGGWQITFSLVFFSSLLIIIKQKTYYVLPLLITFASGELLSAYGKLIFQRIRPDSGVIELSSYAFPSGHSTMAIALYGFMVYLSIEQLSSRNAKIGAVATGSILILAIGFSRLYLGVHYFSDVLAGYLLGSLCLIIGIALSNWLQTRKPKSPYDSTVL